MPPPSGNSPKRKSVRELYQDKKITVIFQPHLYTRTRDFYRDFADSLSLSDEVILTEIYPAREQPIPGVTSQLIYDNLSPALRNASCRKEDVLSLLTQKHTEVLVVLGAGDLDNYAPQITQTIIRKISWLKGFYFLSFCCLSLLTW